MNDILQLLLLNSLIAIGIHLACEPGNIFGVVSEWTADWPEWITRPMFACPTCMASLHSLYCFIPAMMSYNWNAFAIIPYVFALASLNTLIYGIIAWTRGQS